ncbi:T9SS-dependent choice-of-anchor J family protein [Aureispira anguillae]|uniref:T9SS type A sorting domain-containing protein n=1 Tax=Aureispira anguillae TaxID=2864201 RepID=A0A915YCB7_9BACT|nr:T9SS type A sorting domain-containing protein [Aureispira anguillae]BDS10475.1 T9SS type A sorting domain-containing protein [Aureispira anguillae]
MRQVFLYTLFLCLFQVFCHAQCTNPVTSVTANFNNNSTPPCWTLSPSHLTSVANSNIRSRNNNVDQYIILPRTTNARGVLEFDCARETYTGTLIINVGVMSSPNNPSSFINRQTIHISSFQNVWTHQTVNLSSYTGSYQYVAIKFTRSTVNPYGIMRFDNFVYNSLCTPSYNLYERDTICSGDSYTFPDGSTQNNIMSQVVYTSNLQTVGNGCDSIITTTLSVNPTYQIHQNAAICAGDSYTFPNGTTLNNITNAVVDTSMLTTFGNGCDSIVITTLSINPTYTINQNVPICAGDSYTFPNGITLNNITNAVVDTSMLTTFGNGCDSIVITTLSINPTYTINQNATICAGDSYTFPNGTTLNNITNAVVDTSILQTVGNGCDSIVITTLSINPTYTINQNATICAGDSYTFPNGTTLNNITNAIVDTSIFQTVGNGCDSLIITTLSINPTYTINQNATICTGDSYTFPNGTTLNNITNAIVDTSIFQTFGNGCDSLIITTLSINPTYTINQNATICTGDSYTFPNGTTLHNITSAIVDTSILQTVGNGCDSIVVTTLNITTIDLGTTLAGITLSSNQPAASYQWLDCNNSNAAILGATAASFTPMASGDYAVKITVNNCVDTSACTNVIVSTIHSINDMELEIYPNPASSSLTINKNHLEIQKVQIIDMMGKLVSNNKLIGNKIDIQSLTNGTYVLKLMTDKGPIQHIFIKK